jgi:hypothetical protein
MRRQQGFALVLALMVTAAVAILVIGTAFTSLVDRRVSGNQEGAASAYYIAQSGLQHFKTLVFRNLVQYYEDFPGGDWCVNPIAGGISDGDGGFLQSGQSVTVPFAGGQYTVRYDSTGNYIILTSEGRSGNSRATVQLVATSGAGPTGAWDNAIFATGQQQGTKKINGNVAIYGSVQIIKGELELDTDLALDGKASVYNSYVGNVSNPGNSNIVEAMGLAVGGDPSYYATNPLPDLCAKIKIEEGDLILHDNAARAGTDEDPIYSIHLGNGAVYDNKQKTVEITDHKASRKVALLFPENGINSGYEGYDVPFPRLPANYPNDMGFTVTPDNCGWLFDDATGNVSIPPAATETVSPCGDGTNVIDWVPASGTTPAHLVIDGAVNTGTALVNITGPVYYVGTGAIRVGRCLDAEPIGGFEQGATCSTPDPLVTNGGFAVRVSGTVVPLDGGFPETNALGIVSTGDVWISNKPGNPDKEVAALMAYSSGDITLDKQTLVAGALVATSFDMGDQVPKIAFHPGIREAAGVVCMPGAYTVADGCVPGSGPVNPPAAKAPLSDVSYERR